MNKRLQIVILVVAVGGWINFTWLSAEQTDTILQSGANRVVQHEASEVPLTLPVPPDGSTEAIKDPLYQAIRDELRADRPSLIPADSQNVSPSPIDRDGSLSSAEWEAVELILRAARILEREDKSSVTSNRAANHQSNAKQLRSQALQILRRAMPE